MSSSRRDRRRPGAGRHAISDDEHSSNRYEAPSLSPRSTDMGGEDYALTEDEYMTEPSVSITSGQTSATSQPQPQPHRGGRARDGFVTEPPRSKRGLTGKISTLFRRESSSRDHTSRQAATEDAADVGVRRKKPMSGSKSGGGGGAAGSHRRHDSMDQASNLSGGLQSMASSTRDGNGEDFSEVQSHDQSSVASHNTRSVASAAGSKRIFYSNNGADDSDDDSYESRMSKKGRNIQKNRTDGSSYSRGTVTTNETGAEKTIVRYRGFSTSIKNLFLDETVVCASMGCFGLILSNRTEYLLNLRNERRGALKRHQNIERKKLPSRIVSLGLLVTIILVFATFIVFGTGDSIASSRYFDPENNMDYDDLYYNVDNNNADDGNNWNDDGNGNNNDDGNNDDGNAAGDDGYNQNQYNNYNQNGNDDGNVAYNNYNQNGNDDGNAAGNDDAYNEYNAYNNNNGNRRIVEEQMLPESSFNFTTDHSVHGIFKLRDYQENMWDPVVEFVQDEWRLYLEENKVSAPPNRQRQRQMEDAAYDQYNQNSEGDDSEQNETNENTYRDLASNIRMALLFAFLLFLGVLGRRRRMRTRFYLVRARAQEDHLFYASTQVGETKRVDYESSREDQYEGACSHTLCGWYPADEIVEEEEKVESVQVADTGVFRHKKKHHNEDIVARAFNCFMGCCCGFACKCWFQCLSICALAQEAREIRLLVPPRYQRIDFITHQPFHEYQTEVNDLRRGWLGKSRKKSGFKPHFNALSRLSRYIMISFGVAMVTVLGTMILNPRAAFSWPDAIVLGATFLQSFLVLFIVHWIFHKSDLSLDAVIKLFAAGFLIAVPSAFFFEGLVSNLFLFVVWSLYELVLWIGGPEVQIWIFSNWRVIWVLGELFNAFFVAAVTEELCKYYTFRTVEHPDLVFLTGLTRSTQDHEASQGGLVKYPFASHKVQELNRTGSFGEISQYSHRSNHSRSTRSKRDLKLIERTGTTDEEFDEDELDVRTYRQKAMAITTGMISVAVGLACAENFLYVFVLGGAASMNSSFGEEDRQNDILEEWVILVFRSIFPIHALSAALQSINMIRKFVETTSDNGHRIGVGRIILPAIILHGTFDAILMLVTYYQEMSWENYLREHNGNVDPEDGGPYNVLLVNLIAWIGITVVMFSGILWYYREYRKQSERLKVLEEKDKARKARGGEDTSWESPAVQDGHNIV